MELISTPTFSILIIGSPSGHFKSSCGLRQGDTMSPYLFIMVIEAFTILLDQFVAEGKISCIKQKIECRISHLVFADHRFVIAKGDSKTLKNLQEMFRIFSLNTGLIINRETTKLYISCPKP